MSEITHKVSIPGGTGEEGFGEWPDPQKLNELTLKKELNQLGSISYRQATDTTSQEAADISEVWTSLHKSHENPSIILQQVTLLIEDSAFQRQKCDAK